MRVAPSLPAEVAGPALAVAHLQAHPGFAGDGYGLAEGQGHGDGLVLAVGVAAGRGGRDGWPAGDGGRGLPVLGLGGVTRQQPEQSGNGGHGQQGQGRDEQGGKAAGHSAHPELVEGSPGPVEGNHLIHPLESGGGGGGGELRGPDAFPESAASALRSRELPGDFSVYPGPWTVMADYLRKLVSPSSHNVYQTFPLLMLLRDGGNCKCFTSELIVMIKVKNSNHWGVGHGFPPHPWIPDRVRNDGGGGLERRGHVAPYWIRGRSDGEAPHRRTGPPRRTGIHRPQPAQFRGSRLRGNDGEGAGMTGGHVAPYWIRGRTDGGTISSYRSAAADRYPPARISRRLAERLNTPHCRRNFSTFTPQAPVDISREPVLTVTVTQSWQVFPCISLILWYSVGEEQPVPSNRMRRLPGGTALGARVVGSILAGIDEIEEEMGQEGEFDVAEDTRPWTGDPMPLDTGKPGH